MMYMFIPTGGVIRPISTTDSARMPNQIALSVSLRPKKSRPMITGKKIGTMSRIIDRLSMMQPSTNRMAMMPKSTPSGGSPESLTQATSSAGIWVSARNTLNTSAPSRIRKIMPLAWAVP